MERHDFLVTPSPKNRDEIWLRKMVNSLRFFRDEKNLAENDGAPVQIFFKFWLVPRERISLVILHNICLLGMSYSDAAKIWPPLMSIVWTNY